MRDFKNVIHSVAAHGWFISYFGTMHWSQQRVAYSIVIDLTEFASPDTYTVLLAAQYLNTVSRSVFVTIFVCLYVTCHPQYLL